MLEHINQFTVANDVRMRRATFKGAFLLVEGRSDQKLFVKFTDFNETQVVVCRTRSDVIDAIHTLNAGNYSGVVAIIDADFDRVEGRFAPSVNVFFTDAHDAELMMVSCDDAIGALLAEFSSPEKLTQWLNSNPTSLVVHLVEEGSKIGALLLYSIRTNAAFDFGSFKNGLRLSDFVNEVDLRIDINNLVQHVLNRSGRPYTPKQPIIDGVLAIFAEGHPPVELCRGHDLMDLIGFALRSAVGSCLQVDVAGHKLEGYLRVAYSMHCFSRTKLWKDITEWQRLNTPYMVFP